MNRIILIGRLTRDPEVKYTGSGVAVANFSVAVDRRFRNAQGERETDFINIVAWRKTAELCGQYLSKGRQVAIDGTLQMRKYQTQQGENRTVYEVVADNVQFLGDRGSGGGGGATAPPPGDEDAPPQSTPGPSSDAESQDDDLPF